ncbi:MULTISPECIES: small acid-soluble spore protein P [Shouchella]|mgnify:CR=1 FL=1|uniref:Small acid-soluble spore protein P n=4 Tax=Shouchella TaxID=2893057 RepID=A0A060M3Q6_9BACI|nr:MULTISPECIES: small acid-soluble spore protein P [Bacillaceae]RQW21511.1 small acid-soluble spore protein P [Bacillus sp. C1-1]AIC94729.1 small acid-soluble spore protein P [Shouchella lehensis G1]MED4127191.1 small acid-soluble spore protein P [Shouchella miscanthi]TES50599.1 small acid-soluble spore protein P [Shouchella lehensis]WDF03672.1 small acid-soluble spore protein P [Shouchella hunanensis]
MKGNSKARRNQPQHPDSNQPQKQSGSHKTKKANHVSQTNGEG